MVDPVLRSHALNCLLNDNTRFDVYIGDCRWGIIYQLISIYYSSTSSMLSLNNNPFGTIDIYGDDGYGRGVEGHTTITSDELEKDTEFYDALSDRRDKILLNLSKSKLRSKP